MPVVLAALVLVVMPVSVSALPRGTAVRTFKAGLDCPVDMAWGQGNQADLLHREERARFWNAVL